MADAPLTDQETPSEAAPSGRPSERNGVALQRVRKAYEQVADQLRDLVLSGDLSPGHRLPNEQTLAREFGVSRATVREALRVLTSESLVRTARGAGGGSFIAEPSVDRVAGLLRSAVSLLSQSHDVTLEEFLEARLCMEVPAVRLAAERHDDADMERLRASIPSHPLSMGVQEQFSYNSDFHSSIVQMSRNALLVIAVQPIFSVLQTNLARAGLGDAVHEHINCDHRSIAEAINDRDADAAEAEMRRHLEYLRSHYELVWRYARRDSHATE